MLIKSFRETREYRDYIEGKVDLDKRNKPNLLERESLRRTEECISHIGSDKPGKLYITTIRLIWVGEKRPNRDNFSLPLVQVEECSFKPEENEVFTVKFGAIQATRVYLTFYGTDK